MQIIISLYKMALPFLIKVAIHVQSTQYRKLVIFSKYNKKNVSQLLLCSITMQNIKVYYGGPVNFLVTYFWVVVIRNWRISKICSICINNKLMKGDDFLHADKNLRN